MVQSKALRRVLLPANLLKHADALVSQAASSGGNRVFGSTGHNATVKYIKDLLDSTGYYDIELQTFPFVVSDGTSSFSATISGAKKDYTNEYLTYAPSGTVTSTLMVAKNVGCNGPDYDPAKMKGAIVLIKRGTCDFGTKVALAGANGAAAAIIYNDAAGDFGGGSLDQPSRPDIGPYVPAIAISGTDGDALVAAVAKGKVTGTVVVKATNIARYSTNLIATTKGGDKNNVIMAGGHTDSVPEGPGLNDNGSGSMGLLEIALQLPKWSVKNAVSFGFWTAQEYGMVGSDHFLATRTTKQLDAIALYLDFNMIASQNYGFFVQDGAQTQFKNSAVPAGSDLIQKVFTDYFTSVNLKSAPTPFDDFSDYATFMNAQIPVGGLFSGADGKKTATEVKMWGGQAGAPYDPNYDTAKDNKANLNINPWIQNVKAAAHAIATYAVDLGGIPRVTMKKLAKKEVGQRRSAQTGEVM
ncbi:Zn-dependent exopeptidase [Wilcoxina mikolae CBS 423.85]|nr:Zn-dependent exopeptidase [Wilcoxina mikolae CBS 423.85]